MTTDWADFGIYLAKDLTSPGTSNALAASTLKIIPDTWVKIIYGIPSPFLKRVTDNSNAQNIDTSKPDTGTAGNFVEILLREDRSTTGSTLLKKLMQMHFQKSDTTVFRRGRFGLILADNTELECKPTAIGGYKWGGFKIIPDKDNPSTQLYQITLDFIGDHTILGAFQ